MRIPLLRADLGSAPGHLRFSVTLVKPNGDSFVTSDVTTETPGNAGIWDGRWHAVAGTYDGAVARLYVDGHQVSSATVPAGYTNVYYSGASTNDPRLSFGRYVQPGGGCDQSGFQYLGAIDEVRIYRRALTGSEVNYLQTATGATPPELPSGTGHTFPISRFKIAESAKLPGAVRLSGLSSAAIVGRRLVDYTWQITLPNDNVVDVDCGRSPVLSIPTYHPGHYTGHLTVTDSAGQKGSTSAPLEIPRPPKIVKVINQPVFDCENPAAGEQPSTSDCVKSFGFGILDVSSRGNECFDITPEDPIKLKGHLFPRFTNWAAKIGGPVAINGLYVPIPHDVKTDYDSKTGSVSVEGASRIPVRVGPLLTKNINLNLQVTPNKQGVFHVVNVDQAINTPKFLGSLPLRGAFSIDLIYHASRVKVGVGLPLPLSFGPGKTANGDAFLVSDNVNGLHYDGLGISVPNVFLGPIFVNNLSFMYSKSQNIWQGGAKVSLPGSPIALDAAGPPTQPPDFGFGLRNGHFDHAGFAVDFAPPTQPDLFPPFHTVLLSHIGASVGLNPLRLTGTIGISANGLVNEDGVLFGAFASSDTPYTLPDNVGPELAPIAGRTLDSFTLAIGGTASLKVPILGSVPLLNAYGLYEYPDYFEFGGGFSFGISFLQLDGGVSGFVFPSNHTFNIEAGLKACLRNIEIGYKIFSVSISPCLNVGGVVSSNGIGFCGVVPVPFPIIGTLSIPIGAGYRWGAGSPDLYIFSCDYSPYRAVSPNAAHDAAAGQYSFVLPKALPSAMVRVRGSGGAPTLSVTDPHGRSLSSNGNAIVIANSASATTVVALRHPAAGRWTISAAPSSVPIISVATASGLPPAQIRARVTGHGRRRVLVYRLTPAAGRVVTFAERGARTVHAIGVARGRSGRIPFRPAAGRRGRRSVLAIIDQAGIAVHRVVVASFGAGGTPGLGRPARLRARRRRGSISVAWTRVTGAVRYEVLIRLADGTEVFRVVRHNHLNLHDPFPGKRGKVLVDALARDGSRGQTSSRRL